MGITRWLFGLSVIGAVGMLASACGEPVCTQCGACEVTCCDGETPTIGTRLYEEVCLNDALTACGTFGGVAEVSFDDNLLPTDSSVCCEVVACGTCGATCCDGEALVLEPRLSQGPCLNDAKSACSTHGGVADASFSGSFIATDPKVCCEEAACNTCAVTCCDGSTPPLDPALTESMCTHRATAACSATGGIYDITFNGTKNEVGTTACCSGKTCVTCGAACCNGEAPSIGPVPTAAICTSKIEAVCAARGGVFQGYVDGQPTVPNHASCIPDPTNPTACVAVCCDGRILSSPQINDGYCLFNGGGSCGAAGPLEIFFNGSRIFSSQVPAKCPSNADCVVKCNGVVTQVEPAFDCIICKFYHMNVCPMGQTTDITFNGNTTCAPKPAP